MIRIIAALCFLLALSSTTASAKAETPLVAVSSVSYVQSVPNQLDILVEVATADGSVVPYTSVMQWRVDLLVAGQRKASAWCYASVTPIPGTNTFRAACVIPEGAQIHSGTYSTKVIGISADGYRWQPKTTPPNSFVVTP